MNDFIEVRQIASIILKRWKLIVLAVVLFAALGYGVSLNLTPAYEAKATLLVGQSIQASNLSSSDIQIGEHLTLTYAAIGRRQPVLAGTVEALGLDKSWQQLRNQVRLSPVDGTQLLEITVEAPTREEARRIADEIAQQMILLSPSSAANADESESELFVLERLESLRRRIEDAQSRIEELESETSPFDSSVELRNRQNEIDNLEQLITNWESNYAQMLTLTDSNERVNNLVLVEPAEAGLQPVRPRVGLNTALSGILGLGLALGLIILREYTDDSVKTTDDLDRTLGLAPLGAVSTIRGDGYPGKLITAQGPFSQTAEAFNVIRSNIGFLSGGKTPGVVLVTSPIVGEGKSLTAANLALAMSRAGLNTVIVDADLRRPAQHKIFGVPNTKGVIDLLSSPEAVLRDYVTDSPHGSLKIIASGRPQTNPAELLGSDQLELLLTRLVDTFDLVIVDGPPVLTTADAALLASQVDTVTMVIQSRRTSRQEARQAVAILQQAGASVLGAILNRAAPTSHSYRFVPYEADGHDRRDNEKRARGRLSRPRLRKNRPPAAVDVTTNGRKNPEPTVDEDS